MGFAMERERESMSHDFLMVLISNTGAREEKARRTGLVV